MKVLKFSIKNIFTLVIPVFVYNIFILSFLTMWYLKNNGLNLESTFYILNINNFNSLIELNSNNIVFNISYNLNNLYLYLLIILIVTVLLWALPFILSIKKFSIEKNSAYECGFEPFFVEETSIEVHFLIIALLFLIFDLEIIFLVPLSLFIPTLGTFGLFLLFTYLLTVVIMLIVEWVSGALTWPVWYIYNN